MSYFKTGVALGAVLGTALTGLYYKASVSDMHVEIAIDKRRKEYKKAFEQRQAAAAKKREQWERDLNI